MTTPQWVRDAVFYQIFPDRFARSGRNPAANLPFESWDSDPTAYGFKGGDLYGVIEKLDYIKDLGANALYLNPIFASASNHRYHTYDYYNVDPLLGGNEGLRKLLDAAHKKGIRVVLDGVFNHASRGIWQFHHVLETGFASPYKDWFHFDEARLTGKKHWGAYPGPAEIEALHKESSLHAIGYSAWWNLPALPKFNTNSPAVREFLFGVAEHWVRFGIDGWRLDVAAEIDDDSFWQEFRRRVRRVNKDAYIVAEIWHEAQRWLQGDQYDAVMNYPVTNACMAFFAPSLNLKVMHEQSNYKNITHTIDAHEFANRIDHNLALYKREITEVQYNLLDSHDTPRFLTCANGDRSALRLAYLFLMCYPGTPSVYYGDEIGLDGAHDPFCRKSFPWDEKRWDADLRGYMQEIIALRKKHSSLRRGEFKRAWSAHGVYAFLRVDKAETLAVALNTSNETQQIEIHFDGRKTPKPVFGRAENISFANGRLSFGIPPRSGVVLK